MRSGRKKQLVIIGNGVAGHRLCQRLTDVEAQDFFEITVFDEESKPARDSMRLAEVQVGKSSEAPDIHPVEEYGALSIDVRLGETVTSIDRDQQRVLTASSAALYDHLVFATGATSRMPEIPGVDLPGVFGFRSRNGWPAIREAAAKSRSVAVLGGGSQGLTAAQSLCELGLETHLFEIAPRLMPKYLNSEAASLLKTKLENLGIVVHLPARTQRITQCSRGRELSLELNGSRAVDVDMIVVAAGTRPRDAVARASGIRTHPRGGIHVNDFCQTSDPRVLAIGECAEHQGRVHAFAEPCCEMAQVAAKNLLGCRETFSRSELFASLNLRNIEITTIGESLNELAGGNIRTYKRQGVCRNLILEDGYLIGAMAIGPWPEATAIREAIQQRRRVMPWQLIRFLSAGQLFRGTERRLARESAANHHERSPAAPRENPSADLPATRPATSS